ncbi:hypothetical protein [Streptomyces sp. NPDC058657]|uniref:hypothetical protein n=1 Tax=unclassified Streptomyces TaxID=2593676 RepID=UPI00365023C7
MFNAIAWKKVALKATDGLSSNVAIVDALAHFGAFAGNNGLIKAKQSTVAFQANLGRDLGPLQSVVELLLSAGLAETTPEDQLRLLYRAEIRPEGALTFTATAQAVTAALGAPIERVVSLAPIAMPDGRDLYPCRPHFEGDPLCLDCPPF